MSSLAHLPFDHTKLLNVPYVQLLEYAVRCALDNRRFTKDEACRAYSTLAARWDELAPDLLSKDPNDTYIIKSEMFLQYLSLVSLRDARHYAQRAHLMASTGLAISIILLILRFVGN